MMLNNLPPAAATVSSYERARDYRRGRNPHRVGGGLVWILWRGGWGDGIESARIDALATVLYGTLAIVGVVLVSLGLAINRRVVRGSIGAASFEASGGDEEAPDHA